MRGFVFTLEAFLTLLGALSVVLLLQPPSPARSFSDVYASELAQDAAEVGVKAYSQELVSFSQGDAQAASQLRQAYEKMLSAVGSYCLAVEAEGRMVTAGCNGTERESFPAYRTLWDGGKFVRFSFLVKR